jgi:hypothetical protein
MSSWAAILVLVGPLVVVSLLALVLGRLVWLLCRRPRWIVTDRPLVLLLLWLGLVGVYTYGLYAGHVVAKDYPEDVCGRLVLGEPPTTMYLLPAGAPLQRPRWRRGGPGAVRHQPAATGWSRRARHDHRHGPAPSRHTVSLTPPGPAPGAGSLLVCRSRPRRERVPAGRASGSVAVPGTSGIALMRGPVPRA